MPKIECKWQHMTMYIVLNMPRVSGRFIWINPLLDFEVVTRVNKAKNIDVEWKSILMNYHDRMGLDGIRCQPLLTQERSIRIVVGGSHSITLYFRLDQCIGLRNHRAFIATIILFLFTSIYGLHLSLTTICTPIMVLDFFLLPVDCRYVYSDLL